MIDEKIWYYSIKGKAQGPVSRQEILNLLMSGQLKLSDLIFKNGFDKWLAIQDCSEFDRSQIHQAMNKEEDSSELEKTVLSPRVAEKRDEKKDNEKIAEWVLLTKTVHNQEKYGQETRFQQTGPFTTDEIKNRLIKKMISHNDYIWKTGFDKWVKIVDLPEFGVQQVKVNSQNKELLAAVVEMPPELPIHTILNKQEDAPPPEAVEVNRKKAEAKVEAKPSAKKIEPVQGTAKKSLPAAKTASRKFSIPPLYLGIVASVLVAFIGVQYYRNYKSTHLASPVAELTPPPQPVAPPASPEVADNQDLPEPDEAPVPEEILEEKAPVVPAPAKIAVKKEERPKVAAPNIIPPPSRSVAKAPEVKIPEVKAPVNVKPKEASYIKVKLLDAEKPKQAALQFSSDLKKGGELTLTVVGKTGEILKYPGFYRKMVLTKNSDKISVKLASLGLSSGRYTMTAEAGKASARQSFFYGQQNADYRKELESHRKMISYDQQVEKKKLMKALADVQSLRQDFDRIMKGNSPKKPEQIAQWQKRFEGARSFEMKVAEKDYNNLAFYSFWSQLVSAHRQISESALALSGRGPAASGQDHMIEHAWGQIGLLKKQVSQFSAFKAYKKH